MSTPSDCVTAPVTAAVSASTVFYFIDGNLGPLMFWLVLLGIEVVVLGVWLYFCHPGVRATRAMRASVKQGNQQREEICRATDATKAEMDRIARDWEDRW
ncbi:intracellular growth attenuator family protein [Lentzea tibetensis]|uniref:Intracellular growth attenuator family protein n=1 Tax=Lentzea tibetensis TaxID=2591470 RepID=A0A563EI10_9PSEU|nr:intracellular growth attenuator family protein [Lentzea tibetensis]TWP45956.1 intracellular growth attenuator family protein [Lentzea tibetensis]